LSCTRAREPSLDASVVGIDEHSVSRIPGLVKVVRKADLVGVVCEREEQAIAAARAFPGLNGMDLAKVVSTDRTYEWGEGIWKLGFGHAKTREPGDTKTRFHVVAYDFGVKRNILRLLVDRGCRVTVVPAQTPAKEVLAMAPDGIFLSNGPGDPEPCDYAIRAIRELLDVGKPIFGICLGHQILGLALGGRTFKLDYGHRGLNHPCGAPGMVEITSQNHGFALEADSLPADRVTQHLLDAVLLPTRHKRHSVDQLTSPPVSRMLAHINP